MVATASRSDLVAGAALEPHAITRREREGEKKAKEKKKTGTVLSLHLQLS